MMGRLNQEQGRLFYSFYLDEVVPDDHLARKIASVPDLSWVHAELTLHYSPIGRPSIDPALMIRMLIIGYVFAIRSELPEPLSLWSTPLAWLRAGGEGAVILDDDAHLLLWLGGVCDIVCEDLKHARKVKNKMVAQERRLPDFRVRASAAEAA